MYVFVWTYLLFIPHGTSAKNCHFGHSVFLQPFHGITLGTQKLSHKVELKNIKVDFHKAFKGDTIKVHFEFLTLSQGVQTYQFVHDDVIKRLVKGYTFCH